MFAYKITNTVNGRAYIGITKGPVRRRLVGHFQKANAGATTFLARAMRRHGRAAFVIEVLAQARTEADLIALECLLIMQERTFWCDGGYNLTLGGEGRRGGRRSAEEIAKQSARLRGRKLTPEQRARISAAMKGKKKSPDRIVNMNTFKPGHRRSAASIERSAAFHRGRRRKPEAGQKISAALAGRSKPWRVRTHCPKGHPYDEHNTSRAKRPDGTPRRECLTCNRDRVRAYVQRQKEAKNAAVGVGLRDERDAGLQAAGRSPAPATHR